MADLAHLLSTARQQSAHAHDRLIPAGLCDRCGADATYGSEVRVSSDRWWLCTRCADLIRVCITGDGEGLMGVGGG